MSRARFSRPVLDSQGNIVPGGSVMVYSSQTGLPLTDPIYSDIEATTLLGLPYTCDSGIVDFYLDRPQFVNVGYTAPGASIETLFRNVAVEASGYYAIYLPYTVLGVLSPGSGSLRLYVEDDIVIDTVRASVGTAPVGGDIVIDILLDGATSVFSDISLNTTIPDGDNTGVSSPDNNIVPKGHFITMDILNVGATVAGSDLVVQVKMHQQSPDGSYPA